MPAAPPTALDQREAELFAGREAEVRLFVARFEPPPAPDERRVLLFTGVGRLGKSALARAIQRRLEEIKGLRSAAWAAIDFADAGGTDPVQACLQIRLQLGATLGPGVRFPVFDTAFTRYHAKRYPGSDIRSQYQALNPNGELVRRLTRFLPEDDRDASLWQDLADGVAAVAEGVPLLGLGYKRLNQFAHWTQEQWDLRARGLLQDIDAIGADAIALRLPRCLGADLEAAVAGMKARVPIAIIGDTTEAFHRGQGFQGGSAAFHNDAWLRELIWHSPGVLFVLLGRDPLEWHRHEHRRLRDWGRIVETQPVARLTDTEARGILERFPVPEAEIRDRMVAGFAGLPFYLGLQLDLYIEYRQEGVPPSPDTFGGAPAEIVTRFLSHLDPGVKHTLETLAHARLFDDALHRELRHRRPELVSEARLGELTRFSFVEPAGEGTWRLHQLMRDILQAEVERDDPAERQAIQEALFAYWDARCHPESVRAVHRGHEEAFGEAAHHLATAHPELLRDWLTRSWWPFYEAARFGLVARLWGTALSLTEARLGPDHAEVATVLGSLGLPLTDLGQPNEAQETLLRALAIEEQSFGLEHPHLAVTLNNLANVYRQQGNFRRAKEMMERALEIEICAYDQRHIKVAVTLGNLGALYEACGELPRAREALEQSLAIMNVEHDKDNVETARILSNLGNVFGKLGLYAEAQRLVEEALEIKISISGMQHLEYARTLGNLGVVLYKLDNLPDALAAQEHALSVFERVHGPDHPEVARALVNIGLAREALGDSIGAREVYRRALGIFERVHGPDHLEVGVTLLNLSNCVGQSGEAGHIELLRRRALAIFEAKLGPHHPHTRTARDALKGMEDGA